MIVYWRRPHGLLLNRHGLALKIYIFYQRRRHFLLLMLFYWRSYGHSLNTIKSSVEDLVLFYWQPHGLLSKPLLVFYWVPNDLSLKSSRVLLLRKSSYSFIKKSWWSRSLLLKKKTSLSNVLLSKAPYFSVEDLLLSRTSCSSIQGLVLFCQILRVFLLKTSCSSIKDLVLFYRWPLSLFYRKSRASWISFEVLIVSLRHSKSSFTDFTVCSPRAFPVRT